jgi:Protein of unknown function (DUF3027)
VSPTRVRTAALDEACAEAVDLARQAAEEMAGAGNVGDHVGMEADDERVVTHLFASQDLAYTGWRWAVTVTRASRAKTVTVDEVVLLPGPDSLLAPDWVPWSERVRPGDLGVGDLMPAASDDERLVPIRLLEGDEGLQDWDDTENWAALSGLATASGLAVDAGGTASTDGIGRPGAASGDSTGGGAVAEALPAGAGPGSLAAAAAGGGRTRVLSAIGRDTTALRWYSSEHGPTTPLARAAPGPCVTCGFLTPLAGPLGRIFGVCANEYAPDDGRVVSLDHGCGAHSEAASTRAGLGVVMPVIDEVGYDLVDMPGIAIEDTVFESLDHDS